MYPGVCVCIDIRRPINDGGGVTALVFRLAALGLAAFEESETLLAGAHTLIVLVFDTGR